jgi:outer membrane protein W
MCKKVFSFLAISLFLFSSIYAQKGFHLGVNYGVNSVALYYYDRGGDLNEYSYKTKLGSTLGLAAGYNATEHWGANIELNYARLGSDYNVRPDGQPAHTENINLNYVQIPILAKFSAGNYRSRFISMLGPQFGFLSSADMNGGDITSSFKRNDWGLLLTTGGELTLVDDLYVSGEVRLYYGFTKVNTNPYAIFTPELGAENLHNMYGGINIGLHYLFRDVSERPQKAY